MEITCKFRGDSLTIKAITRGKVDSQFVVPDVLAEDLLEKLGRAVNIRSRVRQLEDNKWASENQIKSLKNSEEWKTYNEEIS